MTVLRAYRCAWVMAGLLSWAAASSAAAPSATPAAAVTPTTRLSHGRFRDFRVYRPEGEPSSFAIILSGDEGWTPAADALARQLAQQGVMAAALEWPKLKANLEADTDQCVFPDGDLENLSHFVQAYFHNAGYRSPILVGIGSGAAMAYAMLAQAPSNTFAAALTLGFCPRFNLQKPLCKGSGLEFTRSARGQGMNLVAVQSLANPWVTLQGGGRTCPAGAAADFIAQIHGAAGVRLPEVGRDFTPPSAWMPPFMAAYGRLTEHNPTRVPPPPAGLNGLPVIEIPAQALAQPQTAQPGTAPQPAAPSPAPPSHAAPSDTFAIILSGDGGWAGLDQDVAAALSAEGLPVVGLDSLRYFWTARTPDGLAADIDRMIRHYLAHYGRQRVLLIGYSQGADVLPFAVNRLPADTRARVALTAVMGMSEHALFEFHLSSWIADSNAGPATLPEINRITGMPVLCMYGADESDSLCPKLDPKKFQIVKLKGGHHFDGDYANLARQILTAANE